MQPQTYLILSVPKRYLSDNNRMAEDKKIKIILVQNIKKCRKKQGLTQEQAAEKAGITGKYWQRLEMISQVDLPSLNVLFKIAEALNIKPAKLLEF